MTWSACRPTSLSVMMVLLVAAIVAAQPGGSAPVAAPRPPYLQRGDEVEERYRTYRTRFEQFFQALQAWAEIEAPALRAALVRPTPASYGYQVLPSLLLDPPRAVLPSRVVVSPFSWGRTESRIELENGRLARLETWFADARRSWSETRRRELAEVVEEYTELLASQKLIEAMIQYNRLWQGEIVRYPAIYDELTRLHDAALERQALLDAPPLSHDGIGAGFHTRIDELSRRLHDAVRKLPTPDYVVIDDLTPHRCILRVPVYTDILDTAFVNRFRTTIEEAWKLRDGTDEFSVALEIRRVSPTDLYPDRSVPVHGAHLDVAAHIRRFPPDGVVLTTGAPTTYASGRSIILGPHSIPLSVLVHEFGHMLGFKDAYFRGYRDLGGDGYEVIEVILPPEDIVAAPEEGRVRRKHFDQVVGERCNGR